jgi:RimJ/RimL family protein N-acetyltransferase
VPHDMRVTHAVNGDPVPGWTPRARPPETPITGRTCRLERLDPARHGEELFAAFAAAPDDADWDYLPYGPFPEQQPFTAWLSSIAPSPDPMFHAVIDTASGKASGLASMMRIDQTNGVIEIGHIHFARSLQRTPQATEAIALMIARIFDELGYRRLEWKCNALNERSRAAALRLGFTYEGTFRQASIVKGRNRDTAWFSMLDSEWPSRKRAFAAWLDPANFDRNGRQITRLEEMRP